MLYIAHTFAFRFFIEFFFDKYHFIFFSVFDHILFSFIDVILNFDIIEIF